VARLCGIPIVLGIQDIYPESLVTLHRAENVEIEGRLWFLLDALALLHEEFGFSVVCSLHPRTRSKIDKSGFSIARAGVRFVSPLGFFDFTGLEQNAVCILSEGGTVQEEACIFGVPNVTIRDVTERAVTVECGSNMLAGAESAAIADAVSFVTQRRGKWTAPAEYLARCVAETVCRIVLGYRTPDAAEIEWREKARA